MELRPLTPADRAAWDVLWDGYLRFYRAELAPEVTEATFARMTDGDPSCFALIAADGQRLLGLAHCIVHVSTWELGATCYLEDLFVGPHARGTGAARALIEEAGRTASARGAGKLYWHTQQYNGAARSLYDTVGTLSSHVLYEREL